MTVFQVWWDLRLVPLPHSEISPWFSLKSQIHNRPVVPAGPWSQGSASPGAHGSVEGTVLPPHPNSPLGPRNCLDLRGQQGAGEGERPGGSVGGTSTGRRGSREGPSDAVWPDLGQGTSAVWVFLPPGFLSPIKHSRARTPPSLNTRKHPHSPGTGRLELPFSGAKLPAQFLQDRTAWLRSDHLPL